MILTNAYSLPSAKLLRDSIESLSGVRYKIFTGRSRLPRRIAIRYGNSMDIGVEDTRFNSLEFIRMCANKQMLSTLLRENNIFSPVFYREGNPETYPVLVRTSLNLSGGRGITVCRNENEFTTSMRSGYTWTPYIRMSKEYRAHVLSGNVVKLFIKVRSDSSEEEEEFPIRNLHRGYHFSLKNHENDFNQLKNICKTIYDLTHGEFFALDLGWSRENMQYFVLEANTAPGLNEWTAELYAKFLVENILKVDGVNDADRTTESASGGESASRGN